MELLPFRGVRHHLVGLQCWFSLQYGYQNTTAFARQHYSVIAHAIPRRQRGVGQHRCACDVARLNIAARFCFATPYMGVRHLTTAAHLHLRLADDTGWFLYILPSACYGLALRNVAISGRRSGLRVYRIWTATLNLIKPSQARVCLLPA